MYITQRDWRLLGSPQWVLKHDLWCPHWRSVGAQIWPPLEPATPGGMPWAIHQYGVSLGVARNGIQKDSAGCYDKNRARLLPRVCIPKPYVVTTPVIGEQETLKAAVDDAMRIDWDSFRETRSRIVGEQND